MEVNRQAALDTLDQNKSEEVKANLVSLGLIPPGAPPLEPRMTAETSTGASPLEIKNESDSTPKIDRRLSINPLYHEPAGGIPFSTGFTLSETPSISSEGYKPNLSISKVHVTGAYFPNKLDKLKKNYDELIRIVGTPGKIAAGTPGKKSVFNPHLVKIGKELVETFEGNPDLKNINSLIKKIESGGRPNYKQLELELRTVFSKKNNLMNKQPPVTFAASGNL
jgi:hypothetical protein